jgi:hypothetical protein
VFVARSFASGVKAMITIHANAIKKQGGLSKCSNNKRTQNGLQLMLKYARPAKKLLNVQWVAISWHAPVEKTSVICVQDLGNPITKTTLNVIFIKKNQIKSLIAKSKLCRK